jgi:hypothetical protein
MWNSGYWSEIIDIFEQYIDLLVFTSHLAEVLAVSHWIAQLGVILIQDRVRIKVQDPYIITDNQLLHLIQQMNPGC